MKSMIQVVQDQHTSPVFIRDPGTCRQDVTPYCCDYIHDYMHDYMRKCIHDMGGTHTRV